MILSDLDWDSTWKVHLKYVFLGVNPILHCESLKRWLFKLDLLSIKENLFRTLIEKNKVQIIPKEDSSTSKDRQRPFR